MQSTTQTYMENSLRKTYKKEKNLSMQINFAGAVYQ